MQSWWDGVGLRYLAVSDRNQQCQDGFLALSNDVWGEPKCHKNLAKKAFVQRKLALLRVSSQEEKMALLTVPINPTHFNFLSDIVGFIIRLVFNVAVSAVYVRILASYAHPGRGGIPVALLGGNAPGDFVAGIGHWRLLRYSLPALVFAILLAIGDFSHSVADLGLDFVTVTVRGDPQPTLHLDPALRNTHPPLEFIGDPFFTFIVTVSSLDINNDTLEEFRDEVNIITQFTAAVDTIARGGSAILNPGGSLNDDRDIQNQAYNFEGVYFEAADGISSINLTLPFQCSGIRAIRQWRGLEEDTSLVIPRENTAVIPVCDFTMARDSGIFRQDEEEAPSAKITGHFWHLFQSDATADDAHFITDETLGWASSATGPISFSFPAAYQKLGFDRENWKEGRSVEGISALQLYNVRIDLGAVNLAHSGETTLTVPVIDSQGLSFPRKTSYVLVAEIVGACPPHPQDGNHPPGIDCVAMVSLSCDTFPADVAPFNLDVLAEQLDQPELLVDNKPINSDYRCDINVVELLWGTNLLVDAELVVAIAGVYSRNRAAVREHVKQLQFPRNAVLAAMFMLSTASHTIASTDEVVKSTINLVYVIFMLLPVLVGALLVILLRKTGDSDNHKLIPMSGWELLVTGCEHVETVHHRSDPSQPFPMAPRNLMFGYTDEGARMGLYGWDVDYKAFAAGIVPETALFRNVDLTTAEVADPPGAVQSDGSLLATQYMS